MKRRETVKHVAQTPSSFLQPSIANDVHATVRLGEHQMLGKTASQAASEDLVASAAWQHREERCK